MEADHAGTMLGTAGDISGSDRGRMLGDVALSVYLDCNRDAAWMCDDLSGIACGD